ncbi:hypothetical protein HK098_002176 [Nowakowskiella sp. JEL0407]|nr:hypothetical protein HK098_002176 [Nowakowskiella sp. JEL0407]
MPSIAAKMSKTGTATPPVKIQNNLQIMFKLEKIIFLLFIFSAPILSQSQAKLFPDCHITGCSSEICTSSTFPIVSTCIYLPHFKCLQANTTSCNKMGSSGDCGWVMDDTLANCLQSFNVTLSSISNYTVSNTTGQNSSATGSSSPSPSGNVKGSAGRSVAVGLGSLYYGLILFVLVL